MRIGAAFAARLRLTRSLGEHRLLALNSAAYLIDRLFIVGLNFVTFSVIARLYGPSEMGKWTYALAAINVVAPLLAGGVEPALIRALVATPDQRFKVLGSTAVLVLLSTAVSVGASLGWVWLEVGFTQVFWMSVVFALAAIPNVFFVVEHELKAQMAAKTVVAVHVATALVGASLKLGLAFAHAALTIIAFAALAEATIMAALLIVVAASRGDAPWRWRFTYPAFKDIGRQALPFAFSQLVVGLFFRMNFFLLGRFSTFDQVGKFALAYSIVQALGILPPAISTAVYPRLLAIAQNDREAMIKMLRWIVYAFTVTGYGLCVLCIVASPYLTMVFGDRYNGAQSILVIMSGTLVFNFSGAGRALLINIEALPRYHLVSALAGLCFVGVAGWIVIPRYGAVGAAWVQLIGCFISPFVTTIFMAGIRPLAATQFTALLLLPPGLPLRARGLRSARAVP